MRLVFAGTGTFAEPSFEALLAAFPGDVVGLVTQPERDTGRRSGSSRQTGKGMSTIAAAHSVPVIQPESINSPEGVSLLAALRPDLVVVAAYGQIFKPAVLAVPPLGFVNVHASLLPKYRGAAPVAHAILNGETQTGVTIFRITTGIDTGEILATDACDIGSDETTGELEVRLAAMGARLITDVVKRYAAGPVVGTPQDSSQATRAPKVTKGDGLIQWNRTAIAIHNHVCAMQPWPTAYTYLHRPGYAPMRVSVQKTIWNQADAHPLSPSNVPGRIYLSPLDVFILRVEAERRDFVEINQLQPAGKKSMTAAEFLRGHPVPPGSFFGPEVPS